MKITNRLLKLFMLAGVVVGSYACSDDDDDDQGTVDCSVSAPSLSIVSTTNPSCNGTDGVIEISATGGTGTLKYSTDGGTTTQEATTFEGLSAGEYTITVLDTEDCSSSTSVTLATETSFSSEVSPIIESNCAVPSCHGGSISPSLQTLAEIQDKADRIQARVEAGTMPPTFLDAPLSEEEVATISCWVDGGAEDN